MNSNPVYSNAIESAAKENCADLILEHRLCFKKGAVEIIQSSMCQEFMDRIDKCMDIQKRNLAKLRFDYVVKQGSEDSILKAKDLADEMYLAEMASCLIKKT